jgi:hypothetical protein
MLNCAGGTGRFLKLEQHHARPMELIFFCLSATDRAEGSQGIRVAQERACFGPNRACVAEELAERHE